MLVFRQLASDFLDQLRHFEKVEAAEYMVSYSCVRDEFVDLSVAIGSRALKTKDHQVK